MAQARPPRAVLFDWRGTLVHDPPDEWWVRNALLRAGRAADNDRVLQICDALAEAAVLPEVEAGQVDCDTSAARHRAWSLLFFERAGLDDELALALYELDFDPASHPFYPDAGPALEVLHSRGCRVAVVSDIHFDLRPEFAAQGFDEFVDAFVLSFEVGVQKPSRQVFEIALASVGVAACDALMVGDRASRDGGATAAGIATWLLPEGGAADRPRGLGHLLGWAL